MQNSWTMNVKQNVGLMSRTRITHDKFRSYKVQNGRHLHYFCHYFGNLA